MGTLYLTDTDVDALRMLVDRPLRSVVAAEVEVDRDLRFNAGIDGAFTLEYMGREPGVGRRYLQLENRLQDLPWGLDVPKFLIEARAEPRDFGMGYGAAPGAAPTRAYEPHSVIEVGGRVVAVTVYADDFGEAGRFDRAIALTLTDDRTIAFAIDDSILRQVHAAFHPAGVAALLRDATPRIRLA